jgi:hypothetical protein
MAILLGRLQKGPFLRCFASGGNSDCGYFRAFVPRSVLAELSFYPYTPSATLGGREDDWRGNPPMSHSPGAD